MEEVQRLNGNGGYYSPLRYSLVPRGLLQAEPSVVWGRNPSKYTERWGINEILGEKFLALFQEMVTLSTRFTFKSTCQLLPTPTEPLVPFNGLTTLVML